MADYIFRANIANYKKCLATETDPETIKVVKTLLAAEEKKLADWYAERATPKAVE